MGPNTHRLVNLMLDCPRYFDTAIIYKYAHVLYLILSGLPSAVRWILDDYEEEIKYVLQNQELEFGRNRPSDFFIVRSIPLLQEIVNICLADAERN